MNESTRSSLVDRSTKALLFAVALGLWANAIANWSAPTQARQMEGVVQHLMSIRTVVQDMQADLARIASGKCANTKICQ